MTLNPETTLGIIPCSKAKVWDEMPNIGAVLAENVYTNPFHFLARTYVSLFTKNWLIMSAKYGFLDNKDVIEESYDITFDRPNDPYVKMPFLKKQIENKKLYKYNNIIVVCNNRYVAFIRKAFENMDVNISVPFENIEDDVRGALMLNQQIFQVLKEQKC